MNRMPRLFLIAGVIVCSLAVAFVVAGGPGSTPVPGDTSPPAAAAITTFPGLARAEGEPDLSGLQSARPSPGQILQVRGPFDDRLVFEDLAFDGQAATGAVRITSDVSHLLELQVLAGFYDDGGNFLGAGRFVHHLGSEGPGHQEPSEGGQVFSIPVPAELRSQAVSAAVGVPVLVNE